MLLDSFLVGRLSRSDDVTRLAQRGCTYPRNAQHIIGVPYIRCQSGSDEDEIDHGGVHCPSCDHEDTPLYPPFEPLLLLPLSLNKVDMFGDKVRVYPRASVLELWLRVSDWVQAHGSGSVPLLGLRNEMVMGTVTRVVTVRMKKGKNCPWPESAIEGRGA
jgi:hypothetical protein